METHRQLRKVAKSDAVSLEKCFRMFTKQESLTGANSWYCRMCKTHVSAKKELQLWTLPKVLIIGLKRFAMRVGPENSGGAVYRSKISDLVDYPIDGLNLVEFCGSANIGAVSGTGFSDAKSSLAHDLKDSDFIYDLFAVCNHFGRMGFGHYTSNVREWNPDGSLSDKWFRCDDDIVTQCSVEEVKSAAAYILFYIRREKTNK